MKRKDIDLLIKSAMGEADSQESSQAQALVESSPEAAREAAMWAQMKADFKILADVPECQLSNERMRAAVLSGSIKQRRASAFRFWMPAAGLATAALFAVFLMPKNTVPPVSGSGDAVAITTPEDRMRNEGFDATTLIDPRSSELSVPTIEESTPESVAPSEPAPAPVKRTTRPRQRTAQRVAVNDAAKQQTAAEAAEMIVGSVVVPAMNMAATAPDTNAARAMMSPAPPAPASDSSSEEGVVILSRESSVGNGAPVAVEVGRRHDVVFGG